MRGSDSSGIVARQQFTKCAICAIVDFRFSLRIGGGGEAVGSKRRGSGSTRVCSIEPTESSVKFPAVNVSGLPSPSAWIRPLIAKKQSIHSGSPVINSLSNDALCPVIIFCAALAAFIAQPPCTRLFYVRYDEHRRTVSNLAFEPVRHWFVTEQTALRTHSYLSIYFDEKKKRIRCW